MRHTQQWAWGAIHRQVLSGTHALDQGRDGTYGNAYSNTASSGYGNVHGNTCRTAYGIRVLDREWGLLVSMPWAGSAFGDRPVRGMQQWVLAAAHRQVLPGIHVLDRGRDFLLNILWAG